MLPNEDIARRELVVRLALMLELNALSKKAWATSPWICTSEGTTIIFVGKVSVKVPSFIGADNLLMGEGTHEADVHRNI
jgi:hypothetical protein